MTPEYQNKLQIGLEFQDYVAEKLLHEIGIPIIGYSSKKYQIHRGENKQGIEIKYQGPMAQTKNIYLEVAEKSNPNNCEYIKSGIMRGDSWLFITGDYTVLYILAIKDLISFVEKSDVSRKRQSQTSIGYLLSTETADKICLKKISTPILAEIDKTAY